MKRIAFHLLIVAAACMLLSGCEKEEDMLPANAEELLFAEEAFPNSTGQIVTVEFDGVSVECELINGEYVYQGDIIILPDTKKSTEGAGFSSKNKRWPYGVVYYAINSNLPNKGRVSDAIKHWESKTDIVFVERTDEVDYVEFLKEGNGCSSPLGMVGGKQKIKIADWGTTGSAIHEIGHAMGLIHEQSRSNRDDYVTIVWDNIPVGKRHNFVKETESVIMTEGFDWNSIMLYGPYAFAIDNTNPTITKLDGTVYVPQRNNLSEEDIEIVSKMYSDLHDPVYDMGFADMPGNAHITSDGTYLYSVGDGSHWLGAINKFNQEGTRLQTFHLPKLEGRGLSYNRSDGYLYASVYGGHIVKITDLEGGVIDTVYEGILQNPDASFALSDDGEKMYDFNDGTLKIYDFVTGTLSKTITGLSCGSGAYYGGAAVAVDVSYIYTWDASRRIVYVYNHSGIFQRTLELGVNAGDVGISLSVFDGYLFIADDPTYDPGFWRRFNIRNPVQE